MFREFSRELLLRQSLGERIALLLRLLTLLFLTILFFERGAFHRCASAEQKHDGDHIKYYVELHR